MKEIYLKENKLGRKVFVDDLPIFNNIPKDDLDSAVIFYSNIVFELYQKNDKNRKYVKKKKETA